MIRDVCNLPCPVIAFTRNFLSVDFFTLRQPDRTANKCLVSHSSVRFKCESLLIHVDSYPLANVVAATSAKLAYF